MGCEPRGRRWLIAAVVLVSLSSCASEGTADVDPAPGSISPTTQVGVDTVAPPSEPPPCAVGDLDVWQSAVLVGDRRADAVIRLRNAGSQWCEADISATPFLGPDAEPSVWLDPGGWADVIVGSSGQGCDEWSAQLGVPVAIGETSVEVRTSAVIECGYAVTAIYPVDVAERPCEPDDLAAAVVGDDLLVRNDAVDACSLGRVVAPASAETGGAGAGPVVADLAPGDVVAFGLLVAPAECAESGGDVEFSVAGSVTVPDLPCASLVAVDGRSWFSAIDGPLTPFASGVLDVAAAVAALDPFAGGER